LPEAIARLQTAVVNLAQRAWPLLDLLLQRARVEDTPVRCGS
jgi:hypothetical protein